MNKDELTKKPFGNCFERKLKVRKSEKRLKKSKSVKKKLSKVLRKLKS